MAINKAISSKNAVIQAKEEVGLEGTTRFDSVFKLWAKQCDEKIGASFSTLKTRIMKGTVENCRFELDCDVVAIYPSIFLGDLDCDDCYEYINALTKQLHTNNVTHRGVYPFIYNAVTHFCVIREYTINNNKIVFDNTIYNGKDISVICQVRPTDDEGFVMVHPEYIFPIIEYITMKYAKRTRFTGQPYRFNRNEIEEMKKDYHTAVRNARAEADFTSPEGEDRIKNLLNSNYSGTAHIEWMMNDSYEFG